jgi:hypothetical protein
MELSGGAKPRFVEVLGNSDELIGRCDKLRRYGR